MTAAISTQLALTNGNSLLLYQAPFPERYCVTVPVIEMSAEIGSAPPHGGEDLLAYDAHGRLKAPLLKGVIIDNRC